MILKISLHFLGLRVLRFHRSPGSQIRVRRIRGSFDSNRSFSDLVTAAGAHRRRLQSHWRAVMSVSGRQMSVIPTHIADWAGIIMSPDQWNDTDGTGWLLDAGGQPCPGNGSDAAATLGHAMSTNVYARRRVFINVYVVVGLCAFGFVGNALTVAVLRRDKVGTSGVFIIYDRLRARH